MSVNSVREYIDSLSEDGKKYVCEFVDFMDKEYPQLSHRISFSIPMWLIGKKMNEGYVAISAAKNHFSIHFSDEYFVAKLSKKLPSCKSGKRCISIKYGDDKTFKKIKGYVKEFFKTVPCRQIINKAP